jgi:hypothetical protein
MDAKARSQRMTPGGLHPPAAPCLVTKVDRCNCRMSRRLVCSVQVQSRACRDGRTSGVWTAFTKIDSGSAPALCLQDVTKSRNTLARVK